MNLITISKSLKGANKLLNKFFALLVSVCMMLTLTPAAAFATLSGTDVSSDTRNFSSSGSTEIRAVVADENFKFIDIQAPGKNYSSAAELISAIRTNPIRATFNSDGLPANFTIKWFAIENQYNEDTGEYEPIEDEEGKYTSSKLLQERTYTNESAPKINDGTPYFDYMLSDNNESALSNFLENDKCYTFQVELTNNDENARVPNKTTSTSIIVSTFTHYKALYVTASDDQSISVSGELYVNNNITNPQTAIGIVHSDLTNGSVVDTLNHAAATPENEKVDIAYQLSLDYSNTLPEGTDPYIGSIDVRIPVPLSLKITTDASGNPVYTDIDNKSSNEVNVYWKDSSGEVKTLTGTIEWALNPNASSESGEDRYLKDVSGNKIPVVVIGVSGTGIDLGTFGVGVPLGDKYTLTVTSDKTGYVMPAGADTYSVGSQRSIRAYASAPGYEFVGFEMEVDGITYNETSDSAIVFKSTVETDINDVGYTELQFTPTSYDIKNGSNVTVHAKFKKASTESASDGNLYVQVVDNDNTNGTVTVKSTNDSGDGKIISKSSSNEPIKIPSGAGAYLTFNPGSGKVGSVVATAGPRTGNVAYEGNNLLLGAITSDTTIVVTFVSGTPPTVETKKVTVDVKTATSTGIDKEPATLNGQKVETIDNVEAGSSVSITTTNDPAYDLYKITVVTTSGETVVFESKDTDINDADSQDTNYLDLASIASTTDDHITSTIQIYNIVDVLKVDLEYKAAPSTVTVEVDGGGIDVSWGEVRSIQDLIEKQQSSFQRSVNNASSAPNSSAELSVANNEIVDYKNITLKEMECSVLTIKPRPGYTIGDITIDGVRVTSLLTVHDDDESGEYYSLIIYRGDPIPGIDIASLMGLNDKVYYTQNRTCDIRVTQNTKVIPARTQWQITTSVKDFGGTITPSKKVYNGESATIQFFPDDGYMVQAVIIGGDTVLLCNSGNVDTQEDNIKWIDSTGSKLGIVIENVTASMSVQVSFVSGIQSDKKTAYNLSVTSGAGGTITPSGSFKAYGGTSENFVVVPNTGYEVSSFKVNGKDESLSDQNTYSINSIDKDYNIQVTFSKIGKTSDFFTVSATVMTGAESGTVNPTGPNSVGAGSSVTFTIIPGKYTDEVGKELPYFIKDVCVKYSGNSSGNTGVSIIGLLDGFTLTLPDIQEDSEVLVYFEKSESDGDDGETGVYPGTGEPVPTPPFGGDLITLDPGCIVVNPSNAPGAVVTPSASEITLVKNTDEGAVGVKGSVDFTVTVVSGYELDEPLVASDGSGGIAVKNNSGDVSDQCTITEVSDGVYTVHIPGELVTNEFGVTVNTHPITSASSGSEVAFHKIETKVTGQGSITPSGLDGVVSVENGRNQTFNFIPNEGYKLFTVYVDGNQLNLSNNTYTVSDVRKDMTIEAVFVELEQGESPQVPESKKHTVKITPVQKDEAALGDYSPTGPQTVLDGANLTISVNLEPKTKVSARIVGGEDLILVGSSFEITNITTDLNVELIFMPDVQQQFYNFTVKSSGPGVASPSGTQLVPAGTPQTVSFIPDNNRYLQSVTVKVNDGEKENVSVIPDDMTMSFVVEGNTVVEAEFGYAKSGDFPVGGSILNYSVTTSVVNGKGGTVTPANAQVNSGGNLTITAVPTNGYELVAITDNNHDALNSSNRKGDSYILTDVNSDHVISVEFRATQQTTAGGPYTVIASVASNPTFPNNGGSISPAGACIVPGGGSISITIMPEPGYKVTQVTVSNAANRSNNVTDFSGTCYTLFNVTEDKNIVVTFAKLGDNESGSSTLTHNIDAMSSVGGSISPEGIIQVADGKNSSFAFVPNEGYALSYIQVDNSMIDANYLSNNQFVFTNVTSDHTILAVFVEEDMLGQYHTIVATAGSKGTISPSDSVMVETGNDQSFSVAGFYGYAPSQIIVTVGTASSTIGGTGGVDLSSSTPVTGSVSGLNYVWDGSSSTLTLKNVNCDASVSALFKASTTIGGTDPAPDYTHIGGSVECGPGSGGTTSIGDGGYVANLQNWENVDDKREKSPQVTVTPNDDSVVDKVELKYGDGTITLIDDNGTYEYDSDGYLLDSSGNRVTPNVKYPTEGTATYSSPTSGQITRQGYVEYDAERADEAGGVYVDVTFRKAVDGDESKPEYSEVNIVCTGGGTANPSGRVKLANGDSSHLMVQLLPQNGYEVATVTLDGTSYMNSLTASRKVFIDGDGQNHTLQVTYGYINDSTYYKVDASVSGSGGRVSPEGVEAAEGSSVVISFFPDAGYKIDKLKVTNTDTNAVVHDGSYSLPTYQVNSLKNNYKVEVTYTKAAEGEVTWTIENPLTLNADSGDSNGSVSPKEQLVAEGSSARVYFKPNEGYQIDYILFNGVATTLKNNPAYFAVTPQKGLENKVLAFFKPATSSTQEYVTITPNIANGNATVSPTTVKVAVGDSTQFYIYPDVGYTVDTVLVNGWPVEAKPAVPAGTAVSNSDVYSCYVVTLDNVQADTNISITTEPSSAKRIEIQTHTLTINGENALTLSPLGQMTLAEGMTQKVSATGMTGYYLDSIIATQYDSIGNQVGRRIDLTGKFSDGTFEYTMGSYDTEIYVKYLPVGTTTPSTINVSIGEGDGSGAQLHEEDGTLTDISLDRVSIGMAQMPDGTVIPLKFDSEGFLLNSNTGERLEFVRGASYTFFVSATDEEGNQLVLESATYDGEPVMVGNCDNTMYNVVLNNEGAFHLIFRHLRDGEEIVVYKTYRVWAEVAGNVGGTVSPPDGYSVKMGDTSSPFTFQPNDHYMIERVDLIYYDDDNNEIGRDLAIDAGLYYNNTYCVSGVYANTKVLVTYCEAVDFTVEWNNDEGFITPNPSSGNVLKVPTEMESLTFVIAPYSSYYIDEVDLTVGNSETTDVTRQLTQGQEYADYLLEFGDDYSVEKIGTGVIRTPEDEATEEVLVQSYTAQAMYDSASIEKRNGTTPSNKVFARAYGLAVPLSGDTQDYKLQANFWTAEEEETYYVTLTAGQHGCISTERAGLTEVIGPGESKTISVRSGFNLPLNLDAETGYSVDCIYVNGQKQDNYTATTYDGFTNIQSDKSFRVEFTQGIPGGSTGIDRLVKTAAGLARTGDLTGPVIGFFLLIAAVGVSIVAISVIRGRRKQPVRRR